jgi:DtxR family Mn-dependent transcriptional regulator
MKLTASEENYIKAVYHLGGDQRQVSTNELADLLRTRPASVTDMLKRLRTKKLLLYERYKGFRLSAEGRKLSLGIVRRHRLWESFLSEKLRFSWDEVHEVAEQLEHVGSQLLIDRLDEYLGFPRFDPHGDPIPDPQGKIQATRQVALTECPLQVSATVSHVANQSPQMLEILGHYRIAIGTRLEVRRRFHYDNSLEIRVRNQPAVVVSEPIARNVYVKPV